VSFRELRDVIRVYVEVYGRLPDALLLVQLELPSQSQRNSTVPTAESRDVQDPTLPL
jgi:hypothetical protein